MPRPRQLDLFAVRAPKPGRSRDYDVSEGCRLDVYGIIGQGRAGGENPYRPYTYEHSLFEDGRDFGACAG